MAMFLDLEAKEGSSRRHITKHSWAPRPKPGSRFKFPKIKMQELLYGDSSPQSDTASGDDEVFTSDEKDSLSPSLTDSEYESELSDTESGLSDFIVSDSEEDSEESDISENQSDTMEAASIQNKMDKNLTPESSPIFRKRPKKPRKLSTSESESDADDTTKPFQQSPGKKRYNMLATPPTTGLSTYPWPWKQ